MLNMKAEKILLVIVTIVVAYHTLGRNNDNAHRMHLPQPEV